MDRSTLLRWTGEALLILAIAGLIAAMWLPAIVGPSVEKKQRDERSWLQWIR